MTKQEWITKLSQTKSADEWDDTCDEVKAWTKTIPEDQRSGSYPAWWFGDVVVSGLASRVSKSWGAR